jgi:hypothetical protein
MLHKECAGDGSMMPAQCAQKYGCEITRAEPPIAGARAGKVSFNYKCVNAPYTGKGKYKKDCTDECAKRNYRNQSSPLPLDLRNPCLLMVMVMLVPVEV